MKKVNKALSFSYASHLGVLFIIIVMDTFINKDFDFIRVLIISAIYLAVLSVYFKILLSVFKNRQNKERKMVDKPNFSINKYWLPVFIYVGLIFYLSSISDLPYVSKIAEIDPRKFSLHIMEYTVFGFLLYVAINNTKSMRKWAPLLALVAGITIGVFDELYQSQVPGRRFNPLDILSDWVGIIFGAMIANVRARRSLSRKEKQSKNTGQHRK